MQRLHDRVRRHLDLAYRVARRTAGGLGVDLDEAASQASALLLDLAAHLADRADGEFTALLITAVRSRVLSIARANGRRKRRESQYAKDSGVEVVRVRTDGHDDVGGVEEGVKDGELPRYAETLDACRDLEAVERRGTDLSPRQRQIVSLTAEGFTPGEIADRTAQNPSTVRGHLCRARRILGRGGAM